jgi:hypothetical protein
VWRADTFTNGTTSAPYNGAALWSATNTGDVGAHFINPSAVQSLTTYSWDGNADNAYVACSASTNYVHLWRHSGGNLDCFLNSSTSGMTTASGNTTPFSNTQFRLGRNYTTVNYDGALAEAIFYASAITGASLTSLGQALAAPYGITWT